MQLKSCVFQWLLLETFLLYLRFLCLLIKTQLAQTLFFLQVCLFFAASFHCCVIFCWIICFFVASSLVGVIQAVLFFFLRTHSCNESESVVSCVCVCVNLFLSDVCDKCNDFVFHYLLDYSCRVFVFSCFFQQILHYYPLILKKPLISIAMCMWVQKIRSHLFLVFRGNFNALCSRPVLNLIPPSCSELFPSVCAPFYRIFASGSGRLQSASLFRADSLLFPASICCNSRGSAKKEIAARNKFV